MKKLFLAFLCVVLLTACVKIDVQGELEPKDPEINEELNSHVPPESLQDELVDEPTAPDEQVDEPVEEISVPEKNEYKAIEFSDEYISPYQVLTEDEALEITGGKLYNYSPLDKSDTEKAYITPTGKLVYITDYDYREMCRTENGVPSVFDYETVGPTDFEVNFVDRVRVNVDPNEKLGYEPVGIKINDYRENQEYIKVVVSDFETSRIWYELHAESYQIKDEYSDNFTYMIGCYGIARSGNAWFELGFQAQSDDFVVSSAGYNDDDWAFYNTYFGSDGSMYTKIENCRVDMSSTSYSVGEYRFLARVWDDQYQLAHYELISIKITREYNNVVITVTNYEDEIDPWYLGIDEEEFPQVSPDAVVEEPVTEEPTEEPIEVPVEEPVEAPVEVPVEEPVEVPVSEIEFPTEARFEPGAALTVVEENVSEEFLYMSPDEAQKLTNGSIIPYPEKNKDDRNAYLTPSGKLVYMSELTYSKLPEGTVDFAVNWHSPDNSYGPAGLSCSKREVQGSIIELVGSYDIKNLKYDLYVDYIPASDSFDPIDTFGCYGVAVKGQIDYSWGFKVDSEKYEGCTVRYEVIDWNDRHTIYNAKVGETVMIETYTHDYSRPNLASTEYSDGVIRFITAEIIDEHGAVIYRENLSLCEGKEFANCIELWT